MSLSLKIKGIEAVAKATKQLESELRREINDEFASFAFNVQEEARNRAPKNISNLVNSIRFKTGDLTASVFSTVDYGAYLEFGTRKFAAAYVSSVLPPDWQTYAATFKGGGGSGDFFEKIMRWVKDKGIDEKAAYPIARSILINGIKAQPFLYPAFDINAPKLEQRLKAIVK